ncbi:MAG: hypothetical protein IJ435_09365 [Clostridia bacterium]|nr:hypothetical protein [Clostridia bacterium]
MKENTKIFGFANGNQTSYKLKFDQIEETVVGTTSGKALFDFLWIDTEMFRLIFIDIIIAFGGGDIEQAVKKAAAYVDKNSYLTIYIASFIDYLANGSSEFITFLGSDFIAPEEGSKKYFEKFLNAILVSIHKKKTEIKPLLDEIIKDKEGSLPQRFTKHREESKLFNFDFVTQFDADNGITVYPLETIDDVIRFDIMLMLVNKIKLKPCKCCGEYFIPRGRVNSEYCERIMSGETKPCSEIGAIKTFDIVHKDDAIHKAYITAYRRMDSRQRAKLITKEEFKEFGKLARAERKKCYNGEITLEQFQAWLDEFR